MSSPVDGELKTGSSSSSSNSAPRQRCVCVCVCRESTAYRLSSESEIGYFFCCLSCVCVVVYEESAADLSSVCVLSETSHPSCWLDGYRASR